MSTTSLQASFEELRDRLRSGLSLGKTGDDLVYYLVFKPERMLEVKGRLKEWILALKLDGWEVHLFSMAKAMREILQDHELRGFWLESEAESPLDFESINKAVTEALTAGDALKNELEDQLEQLDSQANALLLITDLEALHPYLRVGAIEQKLQGRFTAPTVVLYPGLREGNSTLRFLGLYPEDGGYRSIHIGG